jgi:Mn2+/Fe2+ NRAMP family transporter
MFAVSLIVLAAEIGGIAAALELATGIKIVWWALPAALLSWGLIWRATFSIIENGVSLLGLVTIVFVVAAVKGGPDYGALAHGLVPTLPRTDRTHYWFVAVSVLGASISPYLYYFYCSGAVEEEWDATYLGMNRVIAAFGMGFGGFLSVAVLVLGAILFHPAGKGIDHYQDLVGLVTPILGRPGFWLFVASLGIACLGATLEVALALAYMVAQGLGWKWSENLEPRDDARFSLTYTAVIALVSLIVLAGADPLKLTEIGMALTAASLPFGVLPFLILMNDRDYLGDRTNGPISNGVVMLISVMAMVLAVVSIPLEIVGS